MSEEENKYDIHLSPAEPSKEEIHQKMDFDDAFKAYSHWAYRHPWHRFQIASPKNRRLAMFIILGIIVASLILFEKELGLNDEDAGETPIELLEEFK